MLLNLLNSFLSIFIQILGLPLMNIAMFVSYIAFAMASSGNITMQ